MYSPPLDMYLASVVSGMVWAWFVLLVSSRLRPEVRFPAGGFSGGGWCRLWICLPSPLKVAAALPDGCTQFNPAQLAYRGSASFAVDGQLPALSMCVGNVNLGYYE